MKKWPIGVVVTVSICLALTLPRETAAIGQYSRTATYDDQIVVRW